ncbi:MAG TPA: FAD-binding oxidoreductase, partial [Gemmatimonadales bacterium]|nr:FAD-binding oxidoreductase [Gemmatimonadales bacterium]
MLTDTRVRAAYSEGAGIYRIIPAGVALPRGVEELQDLVRWAADTGTPLVPRGAGSGMPGGAVGRGVVVDLSPGFHWLAPDWSHRAVWVGASVTAAQIGDAARPFGLRLAPDPSSGAFATSGGLTATNAAGPRS